MRTFNNCDRWKNFSNITNANKLSNLWKLWTKNQLKNREAEDNLEKRYFSFLTTFLWSGVCLQQSDSKMHWVISLADSAWSKHHTIVSPIATFKKAKIKFLKNIFQLLFQASNFAIIPPILSDRYQPKCHAFVDAFPLYRDPVPFEFAGVRHVWIPPPRCCHRHFCDESVGEAVYPKFKKLKPMQQNFMYFILSKIINSDHF